MASDANSATPGRICWTEIPCTDLTRVQKFYSTVFNWTVSPSPNPQVYLFGNPYHGNFLQLPPEKFLSPANHPDNLDKSRVAVRVTIAVESIDETLKEIEKAGGSVYTPKRKIPDSDDMGWVAFFLDTEKNVMGIWSLN